MRKIACAAAFAALFAAAPAFANTATEADQAIKDATAAADKAASVGGEWRDTRKIIEKAQDAAESGDSAAAVKLANKAKAQAELGYAQAMSQKDAAAGH